MVILNERIRKTGLKLVSVILAILLWIYVVNTGDSKARQNTVDVKLNYYHLADGLTASGPDKVTVKLWGSYKETSGIIAYVDLAQMPQGSFELPVKIQPVEGVMFSSVEPNKVRVALEQLKQYSLPIIAEVVNKPAEGYELMDTVVKPDHCIIEGTQNLVKTVVTVACPVDLSQVKDITNIHVNLQPRDKNGKVITGGIRLIPESVTVYAVVNPQENNKRVKARVVTQGETAKGFILGSIKINPETVLVLGSDEQLQSLNELDTKPLDISGKNSSFTQEIDLVVPEGIKVYPSTVLADIEIKKSGQ